MNNGIKNAFTLVELLVVIAIVGILSGLIIVGMNSSIQQATIAKSEVFSSSLRNSILSNLISEWKFDETSGTTTYDTWGTNNGTLTNFALDTTDGWRSGSQCVYDGCLQFDGVNDYVALPDSNNLKTDDITIEAWIKPSILNVGSVIRTYSTSKFYMAFGSATTILFWHVRKADNTGSYQSYALPTANQWYHVVGTYKSATFQRFYINGSLVVDASINWTPLVVAGLYNWRIGFQDWNGSPTGYYGGLMDNVRIYNTAVSTSQIKNDYYTGLNRLLAKKEIDNKEYERKMTTTIDNVARNEIE